MNLKLKMVLVIAALFAVGIALFGGITLRQLRENQAVIVNYQNTVATDGRSSVSEVVDIGKHEKNAYLFILAGAMIASLVTWLSIRHLMQPLDELKRQIGEMSESDVELKKVHIEGESEIIRLADAFNSLVDRLNFSTATRRAAEDDLIKLANYDPLTGLPNRNLLLDRLHQATSRSRRQNGLLAICFIDLDNFNVINDQYGHAIGDRILSEVAKRLSLTVRGGDTLGRIGGDEFVVLLTDLNDIAEMETGLQRIQQEIATPFTVSGMALTISASIGVTLYPLDDAVPDTLIRHADQAMYRAKQSRCGRIHLFDAEHDKTAQAKLQQIERLRAALHADETILYYQPKVNMANGTVVGMEALIRWNHPERGLLAPAEFLSVADERNGLVFDVGEWAIKTAMRQIERWQKEGFLMPVSVNISANHLLHAKFVDRIDSILKHYPHIPPECLELEILETEALEDTEKVSAVISACHELGIKFSVDDFGTGYSNLKYLKDLPANTLKIDQSFVRNMLNDNGDLMIVKGVISLAEVFDRNVIAEGVETAAHGAMLLKMGCKHAQGYGISRPMPADKVLLWVKSYEPDSAWANWL